jgi:hypothetical protein
VIQHRGFSISKSGLTLNVKDDSNANATTFFDRMIGIDKSKPKPLRKQLAQSCLPRGHWPDEENT